MPKFKTLPYARRSIAGGRRKRRRGGATTTKREGAYVKRLFGKDLLPHYSHRLRKRVGGRKRRIRGGDFLGIGNWIRNAANTVYHKVLRPAHDFAKKNKVISTAAGLGSLIPGPIGTASKAIGIGAKLAGYGRRKRGGASFYRLTGAGYRHHEGHSRGGSLAGHMFFT